jgi:type 1 fimbriae regulatory protein FimB/type 1 fimbriae regulatory protein FimE
MPAAVGLFRKDVKPAKVVSLKRAKRTSKSRVSGTVPNRKANDAVRTRSHLTEAEVTKLLKVAKQGRYGQRDHLMILMAFRHGLRVSNLCDLPWSDIEFRRGTLHVRRLKGSKDSTHYLEADEPRPLKALYKASESPYVFTSERGGPMSPAGFRKQLVRWGEKAKLGFPIHPHMLRHACGYALANRGMDTRSLQAYLGHASITHTVRYTEMSPTRFKGIWKK